ncbi:MAG: protein-disulfide reductase DsbD N-terminal domain-containing protein [Planctomycetaceae bacterium]|nr:protein-disulfide reductase DsbD N-terminal domain-containing protein [Planctomycetaceae bacterium]
MFRTTTLLAFTLLLIAGIVSAPQSPAAGRDSKRIKPQVFLEYNKLLAGGKCRVVMEIQVEKGWHINANPAMPSTQIATEFTVKSTQGVKLTNVKYPKYHVIEMPGVGNVNVYDGKIQISGVLEIPASAAGKVDDLKLEVRYQACDDRSCEPPQTATIQGKIPVTSQAGELKKTNLQYFE